MSINTREELSARLLQFHRDTAEEYRNILKWFNLYIHGHGCKRKVLDEVFPKAYKLDLQDEEIITANRMMYEYFKVPALGFSTISALIQINKCITGSESKILIVYNATREIFPYLGRIKTVIVHHKGLYLPYTEFLSRSFIMRDFSTLENEAEERDRITDKVEEVLNVYECVGPLSQRVFKILLRNALKRQKLSLQSVFQAHKRYLLLVSFSAFRAALNDFFDGKIIAEKGSGIQFVGLSQKALKRILGKLTVITKTPDEKKRSQIESV